MVVKADDLRLGDGNIDPTGQAMDQGEMPTTSEDMDIPANLVNNNEEEYVNLRCSSVRTEVLSDRRKRRIASSGYPGLAFGSSIFNSNSMMKFSLIANELHNIMNVQLKRV